MLVVFLHGFTQTRQSWRRTIAAGRYRAIAPDLPGHGQASERLASFAACAAYVRALAEYNGRLRTEEDWQCGQRATGRHLSSIAIPVKQAPATEQRVQALTSDLATVNALADRYAADLAGANARIETLSREIDTLKREHHVVTARIVGKYESLSILRLRSALMRIPIAGPAARRASRWLAERLTT